MLKPYALPASIPPLVTLDRRDRVGAAYLALVDRMRHALERPISRSTGRVTPRNVSCPVARVGLPSTKSTSLPLYVACGSAPGRTGRLGGLLVQRRRPKSTLVVSMAIWSVPVLASRSSVTVPEVRLNLPRQTDRPM